MSNNESVQIEMKKDAAASKSGCNCLPCAIVATIFALLLAAATAACGAYLYVEMTTVPVVHKPPTGENYCAGRKPDWANHQCMVDDVIVALEQAGADVTAGYVGGFNTTSVPTVTPYYRNGLCPVNVHWHLGAEHRSAGQYDENGKGPDHLLNGYDDAADDARRKLAAKGKMIRKGLQCHHYDASDTKFTKEYDWKHCVDMHVGQTYEVHWPHSAAGACGTLNQYQTPFYDGVFCSPTAVNLVLEGKIAVAQAIGVQAQVYTIVNDEDYYYPDMIKGMIVDGDDHGVDVAAYTGSTTGTTRSNTICSRFAPITWQVDRKCHLISASSFDKMCKDMKAQRDDMTDDLHAHGSREIVANYLTANNLDQQNSDLFPEHY